MKETDLCKLAFKYKTDKCPKIKHSYTSVYHELFKDIRNSVKKVVEVGIGSLATMDHVRKVTGYEYTIGASLKMWRDYFPNAQIYGVDIEKDAMIEGEERIKTFLLDETKKDDIEYLIKQTGTDIDIFIDDGDHTHTAQLFLANTVLPMLNKGATYVIEDVFFPERVCQPLEKNGYKCNLPSLEKTGYRENLVVIEK